MNLILFVSLLGMLGLSSIWLGSQRSKNRDDYFLMGRKLGLFSLVMTLLATQIGGGALLGAAEEAYAKGWSVIFYPLGMVLGLIVLGCGYGAKMRKLNLTTIPEIFEKTYGSTRLRSIASLLSITSLFFILVGQGIAARKFFASLGFHGDLLFILFWCVLMTYTVLGGLRAVVKTDILQTLFILTAFSIIVIATLNLKTATSDRLPLSSDSTPWMTWLLMPLLFMLIEQDMGQRCFAAKNPKTVSTAAITAAILLLAVSFVPIYLGTLAGKSGLPIEHGSSVLITTVKTLTNPTLSTILICAILMAIISTADSLLCSVSSNIACDFPRIGNTLFVSQFITLGVGLSTLFLSFLFSNVVMMLMFSYELAVSILFVPVTMAIWTKTPQQRSAIFAMSFGAISFLTTKLGTFSLPNELINLGSSFLGFALSESAYKLQLLPNSRRFSQARKNNKRT